MPVYQYKGYRTDGGAAAGIVDAESPKVARLKLRKVGVFPTDMVEQGQAKVGSAGKTTAVSGTVSGRSPLLTTTDVALMTRQLATLLVAGLPLVDALGVLVDQADKKVIKSLMADVREQIRGGKSLSAVLEQYPKDFTQTYVHKIRTRSLRDDPDHIHQRPPQHA